MDNEVSLGPVNTSGTHYLLVFSLISGLSLYLGISREFFTQQVFPLSSKKSEWSGLAISN